MKRRDFNKLSTLAAAVSLTGCGGGGGGEPAPAPSPGSDAPAPGPGPGPAPGPAPAPTPAPAPLSSMIGVNLSGMQWAEPAIRYNARQLPNVDFTVPRKVDVAWLGAQGYGRTRLPFLWEQLQPMLFDTVASAAVRAAVGNPGEFDPVFESYITGMLDAHAQAGMKCVLDLHNFARYRDFVYRGDGSVGGLVVPDNPLLAPYTTDISQVRERLFALAPGATLTRAHFNDFWTRAARKWKDHPGFGGYGLMNEPSNLPPPGGIVAGDGSNQDLTIWPTFAQSAIDAIRAIDPVNPIYVGGNSWSAAWTLASANPGFPLTGANLIYEVHMYLDAFSNGQNFDYDTEVAKNFTAGFGDVPINPDTGMLRLKSAGDWAQEKGVKLALAETGMPIDDTRWEEMFRRLLAYAKSINCEVYTWNAGNHFRMHNNGINHVPGWHEHKTLEPIVTGLMKNTAGIAHGTLFSDGAGWAPPGGSVNITVYARGNLASPVTLTVSSNNGGSFSKTQLTIPAGYNGQDSFTFTPGANRVSTLSYTTSSGLAPPLPDKVFSLSDPVAYAATSVADAAMAIIAKYSACKWEMVDGFTDYLFGAPSGDGQVVRAIADSGYGSSPGNAMAMLNWINNDSANMGSMVPPVMRAINGRRTSDHSAPNTFGFWCKKTMPLEGSQANPRNKMPYNMHEPHFVIAAASVPGANNNGVLFLASHWGARYGTTLRFANSQPQAQWIDNADKQVVVTSPTPLAANTPAVMTMTSAQGAQQFRVNSTLIGTGSQSWTLTGYDSMQIGWGFQDHLPVASFGGHVYVVISGRGVPTNAELAVLERYLGSIAGV